MRRLRFTVAAGRDLRAIATYLLDAAGDAMVARGVVSNLRRKCADIARWSSTVGRPRPELAPGLRSLVAGSYLIFFRYEADAVTIVAIVEGHRDLQAYFGSGAADPNGDEPS